MDKQGHRDLHVPVRPDEVQADVRQRHRKGAEVHHVDGEPSLAARGNTVRRPYPDANSVSSPAAPEVQDAQRGAQHSDGQGDGVCGCLVYHAAEHTGRAARAALRLLALAAVMVGVLLALPGGQA